MSMRPALVLLFIALSVASTSAQMRGHAGHHGPSVSFRGGVGFRSGPHFGGGRVFGGPRFFPRGHFGPRFFPRGHFFPRFHHNRFFFGSTVVFGGFGYPYYPYPYYAYPSYYSPYAVSSYDSYYDRRSDYQAQQLSQQVYNLSSEVRQLRDQNDQLRYDLEHRYSREEPQSAQVQPQTERPAPTESTELSKPAVIILKNGRRLETRSYAVAGETLWILSPDRAQKVSFSDLDVQATKSANAVRGIELPIH